MAKIVIDVGHGGYDQGAVNGRYREANANLGISLKLADQLTMKGHEVVMTRETDKALTLAQRCMIANELKADVFVSIHCNAASNKETEGIETYKYPKSKHKLAESIQNALVKNFPDEKNRGVKEAQYYILKNTNMAAALVEVGFISHDETAEKLFRFSYQEKLARVIAEGVESYLKSR